MKTPMSRVLATAWLAASIAGCANTPRTLGMPWWPQGPGDSPEEVEHQKEDSSCQDPQTGHGAGSCGSAPQPR